ncbi:MAG: ABC-F family ATP-binding cassette domain-containing protein [Acidobacteria bacterium]|nr:ABC-F family ATP-binding cassette domain-containing protein [Acidobacteriota bacterium]
MLTCTGLSKSYGAHTLFRGASLQLHPGQRYGIVGANGSGKSTLLKILAGDEEPSEGEILRPRRSRLGVLRQDHFQYETTRILDVVLMGRPELWSALLEKEAMLAGDAEAFDVDRFGELEEVISRNDGYSMEARASEILEGLQIPTERHQSPLSVLSGGFKLRVLMAQTLASDPDVLLLDEPTNHLDILSIRWLEKFLQDFKGVVAVVSHDHRFLNNVCTHIVDVDYERVTVYKGNYDRFQTQKREDRERLEAEIAQREKEVADHKAMIERFKAKPTKARQAQSKVKLVEKIVIDDLPRSSRRYPRFQFTAKRPSGKDVLEIDGVSKSYDDKPVLNGVSLRVQRDDRLAIIGPNGIGKSTLLKIAMGVFPADAGQVRWGYETHPGYFAQDHRELTGGAGRATVESWLADLCPGENRGFVRGKLAQVLFEKDDVEKRVSTLSGGEAARLLFASLALREPNVLVLDEPTNHLDLEGIEALAQALERYEGTILFVSHDRWFVSKLATRIVEVTRTGVQDFRGTYAEYLEALGDDHLDIARAS